MIVVHCERCLRYVGPIEWLPFEPPFIAVVPFNALWKEHIRRYHCADSSIVRPLR